MVVSICGLDVGVGVVEENGEVEQVLHERLHREEMEGCKQRCTHAGHNVLLSLGKHVMYCHSENTGYIRKRCQQQMGQVLSHLHSGFSSTTTFAGFSLTAISCWPAPPPTGPEGLV